MLLAPSSAVWCILLLRPQVPGVVGFYSAKDVPGSNMIGPVWTDEEVFAVEEVTAVGQVGGLEAWSTMCIFMRWVGVGGQWGVGCSGVHGRGPGGSMCRFGVGYLLVAWTAYPSCAGVHGGRCNPEAELGALNYPTMNTCAGRRGCTRILRTLQGRLRATVIHAHARLAGTSHLQVIGIVVATSESAARAGARAVEVGYEDLPAVMSIEEAIEAGAFYEDYKGKVRGHPARSA